MSYKELIYLIAENIDSPNDKKFIIDNIDNITQSFIYLNTIITKINTILTKKTTYNEKIKWIKKLGFNNGESKQIITTLSNNMLGGAGPEDPELGPGLNADSTVETSMNTAIDSNINKIPGLMLAIPKNIIYLVSNSLEKLRSLLIGDKITSNDFKTPLDIIYIFLFITASLPIIGILPDFIIICRAFSNNKKFLAVITLMTRFLSFFTLNLVDIGIIFKILYGLDHYSYINYSKDL